MRLWTSGGVLATLVSIAVGPLATAAAPPPPTERATMTVPFDDLPRHAATHLNFVVVGVVDSERAIAFYTRVLGMVERGRAMPDRRRFEVIVGFDRKPLTAGVSLKYRDGPPEPRGNGSSALNLVVRNLRAMVDRVAQYGGRVTTPYARHDTRGFSYGYATIEDPDGNAIELVEYHRLPER